MTVERSTSAPTIHIDNGAQVYPCRCGQTHRGPYGAYDYGHHNCLHDAPLIVDDVVPEQAVCIACGKTFVIQKAGAGGS